MVSMPALARYLPLQRAWLDAASKRFGLDITSENQKLNEQRPPG